MIFGVDLGTRRIAVACPAASWVFSFKLEGARKRREFPTEVEAGAELGRVAGEAIGEAFGYDSEHLFFFERPVVGRPHGNVQTAIGQALSAGAVFAHFPGHASEIYPSSLWKKALCDNGRIDKSGIRVWVEDHQPALAALCGEDQDAYDAVALGCYGALVAPAGGLPAAG